MHYLKKERYRHKTHQLRIVDEDIEQLCSPNDFRCSSSKCIHTTLRCNWKCDSTECSDENHSVISRSITLFMSSVAKLQHISYWKYKYARRLATTFIHYSYSKKCPSRAYTWSTVLGRFYRLNASSSTFQCSRQCVCATLNWLIDRSLLKYT